MPNHPVRLSLLGAITLAFLTAALPAADVPPFESAIAPLLIRRCVECHQGNEPAGGLLLTTRAGLLAGGESGAVISADQPDASYLVQRVLEGEMPPEKQGRTQKLPDDEIQVLRKWIAAGFPWPEGRQLDLLERTNDQRAGRDWWSLQPVQKPGVPQLERFPQPENPIDAFVLAELERRQLTPAPRADKRTLIRRLYYDLIGLPPTSQQIAEFVADESPDAWERAIDRLLVLPQYGERWGRYWLDLARYADTSGYERDQEKPFAWKYRDWVVQALNDDLPFDRFVLEQLAGDELPDRTEQSVIATGFLRLGTWNDEPNQPLDYQYDRLEDLVHTTSTAFLGLTVKCARCHSHKFDPIQQEDYYRMAAAFWAGPISPRDSKLLGGPTADELRMENVLAWTDLSSTPPPLHLLHSGERTKPRQEIVAGVLSAVPALHRDFEPPPAAARTSHRRLQLAQWIIDPRNPLTPRVLVNRLWQHHFGQGIVRTPNNFGFLADPATHPQLLDWLAAEFIQGGWRIKRMHKLILTSQTWQQASLHAKSEEYSRVDAGNRLWWRAERRRLDAESLRDSMLAAAGKLDLTVGGEGFRATISPEALEGLSRKDAAWQASPPDKQNRRSLYMFLKRGLLPPMMTAFDLCDATQSCGQRDVTIVPTQALALLNNQFTHDCSQHLAAAVLREESSQERQLRQIWSRILGRQPTDRELERSLRHVALQRETIAQAQSTPPPPPAADLSRIELALQLHLRADQAATTGPDQRVESIPDLSGQGRHAVQRDAAAQPILVRDGFAGQPILAFDGRGRFLRIEGQPLSGQECTFICVVSDRGEGGHREIISNWNRDGNSGSSLFLGLTGHNTVRFSDALSDAGQVADGARPFILSAVNGSGRAAVFQNGGRLGSAAPLPPRRLNTPWVVGQQGNIDGEYWTGGIAEIRVYGRDLSDVERQAVEAQLAERYGLTVDHGQAPQQVSPEILALASLCQVLLNSNEFLYVD